MTEPDYLGMFQAMCGATGPLTANKMDRLRRQIWAEWDDTYIRTYAVAYYLNGHGVDLWKHGDPED